jgi:nitrosocyanin
MRFRIPTWIRTSSFVVPLLAFAVAADPARADDTPRSFTVVNIEYAGTKVWVPATLVVKQGERVRIKLVNNVPSDPNQHGFAIPAYGVQAVVTRGEPSQVEFVADKAGLFPTSCQLHPAHIGGQLVVLE